MATTLVTTPNSLSPMNDMYGNMFILSNSNYSLVNFKYLTKLYANGNFLVKETQPPRPVTGYGLYSPYKSISSIISYDLNSGYDIASPSDGCIVDTKSIASYYINYGFEYNPGLTFAGTGPGVILVGGGHFGFSFSTPHGFLFGDQITIQSQNPYISGTATVTNPITTHSFFTNLVSNTSSNVSTGTITDLQRWEGTSSTYWGYNGTRQYGFQNEDYTNDLLMGYPPDIPTAKYFLSDYNNFDFSTAKAMYTKEEPMNGGIVDYYYPELLSFIIYKPGYTAGVVSFYFYDIHFNIVAHTYSHFNVNTTNNQLQVIQVGVGPYNVQDVLEDNPSVAYWTVQVLSNEGANNDYSQVRWYRQEKDSQIYNNVKLMWLNSYGGWDYFDFKLDDHKTYNITRQEYKKQLSPTYVVGDRERTILSSNVIEQHTVNTNWISESDYAFLNHLLISPEVYVLSNDDSVCYPIIITDTSFDFKTAYRDQIFQLTLTYQMSYGIETQTE